MHHLSARACVVGRCVVATLQRSPCFQHGSGAALAANINVAAQSAMNSIYDAGVRLEPRTIVTEQAPTRCAQNAHAHEESNIPPSMDAVESQHARYDGVLNALTSRVRRSPCAKRGPRMVVIHNASATYARAIEDASNHTRALTGGARSALIHATSTYTMQ